MKKWFKLRLPVLLLALCLVGSMLPTAFAANNNAALAVIQQANEENNFMESLDVVDPDRITPITIRTTGEHAHEIYQEEVGTLLGTANQNANYYCAAILPEGGTAADVRYTMLEKSGNRLLLTYRWNWSGDKTVNVMVVEPVLVSLDLKSNGGGESTINPSDWTIYHFRDTAATYAVPFRTTLKISDGLAKVAKTFLPYKRYKAFWDDLTFTCYARLPEAIPVTQELIDSIRFDGNTPFEIVSKVAAAGPENGINITCKLNGNGTPGIENTVNNFYYEANGTFKLTDTMVIVGTAKISGAKVQELYDNGQKIIHTVGSTTLSGFPQIALTPEFVKDPYLPGEDYGLTDDWIVQHPEWDTKESLQVPAMAAAIRLVVLGDGGNGHPDIPPVNPDDTGVGDLLNAKDHIAYMQGNEKGMFRPYANITRAEVVQMFYNLLLRQDMETSGVARFKDVPSNAWYAKAVYALTSLGIVNGVGNGDFAPYRNITRAEFAVIASRFAKKNYETSTGIRFSDVPTTYWAYHEITRVTSYGWIEGNGEGQFLPNRNLSRAEAATITNRMLRRLGDRATINESEQIRRFPDVASRSEWFYYQVYEATTHHDYVFNAIEEDWTRVYPWNGFWQHW